MTREEARKAAEVMLAYANGKEIETLRFEEYVPCENPSFNWIDGKGIENYRIKPESKYRPFKSQEECWNEMHKHPDFGWVVAKDKKSIYHIYVVGISYVLIEDRYIGFPETFANYEFTDGTPFGIKEE